MLKDYYKILEIPISASTTEIKKSYRRLALKYHPDKNLGNNIFEARFKEITEAYKVLSDLKQRQEYNTRINLFSKSEIKKPQTPVTPTTLLNQAISFRKKIAMLDPERVNLKALYQHIQQLLSKTHINIILQHNDPVLNKKFINELLFCSKFLPHPYVEKICFQLTALAGTDNKLFQKIYAFNKESKRREIWNKYKLVVALTITIIFCLFIFLIS